MKVRKVKEGEFIIGKDILISKTGIRILNHTPIGSVYSDGVVVHYESKYNKLHSIVIWKYSGAMVEF